MVGPIYVTICWTNDGCDGQVDLKLHLSVGQVILFPYFDHWVGREGGLTVTVSDSDVAETVLDLHDQEQSSCQL